LRNKGYLTTTILEKLVKALPDSEQRRGAKRELKRRYKEKLEEEQLTPREEELKFINYNFIF